MMKETFIKIITTCAVALIFSAPVAAQSEIRLTDAKTPMSIENAGIYYFDETGTLDFKEIQKKEFSGDGRTDFAISDGKLWTKYRLKSDADQSWILSTRWHKIDSIDFFLVRDDGTVTIDRAGLRVPLSARSFNYRRPAFSFALGSGEEATVYISMRSRSAMYRDFYVATPGAFFHFNWVDEAFVFFYFGAIIVIAIYNLMVYITSRDRNYLFYFLYVFFMLMYQVSVEGYGNLYIWPNWEWFWPRSYNIFIALLLSMGLVFTRSYLDLRRHSRRLAVACDALTIVCLAIGIAFIATTAQWLVDIGTLFILVSIVFIIATGWYVLIRRYEPAMYFVLAWTFLIAGTFVTTATRIHWLPHSWAGEYALHIGNLFEVVLLALALGDRVRIYQRKKLEAEEALIDANGKIMQNRMKPHFLFNSMNIIFNQLKENPEQAQKTLLMLSDNYHYLTDCDAKPLVPLSDEWDFLRNYLTLMEQRWPGHLTVVLSFDERIARLPVPPAIIQPLAENAFKYGLRELIEKELVCTATLTDTGVSGERNVSIRIENGTVSPIGPIDFSRSLGNIQARLRRYYPDATISLTQQGDRVIAEIKFTFPG